jgi:hypothetical protein
MRVLFKAIMNGTPIHTEATSEAAIEQHLLSHGSYEKGNPDTFLLERAIALPTEYRTALITEAVTGRVEVS